MRCSRCIFFFFFNFYEHCALRSNFEPRPRQRDFIARLRRDAFLFNTSPLDVSFLRKKSRFLYSRQNVNGRSRACVYEHGSGQIFFSFFAVLSAVSFHSRNPSTNFLSVFLSFLVFFFYSFIFLSFFLFLIRRLFSVISKIGRAHV